jgi:hypothetical protein
MCRFFRLLPDIETPMWLEIEHDNVSLVQCRRHAPVLFVSPKSEFESPDSTFPYTWAGQWCGEFEQGLSFAEKMRLVNIELDKHAPVRR